MDIISMLDALESLSGNNTPEHRVQREFEKLKNVASVDHIEAINIGLAQCCAYARWLKTQPKYRDDTEAWVGKLGQLLVIMAASNGVNVASVAEPRQ